MTREQADEMLQFFAPHYFDCDVTAFVTEHDDKWRSVIAYGKGGFAKTAVRAL